MSHVIQRTPNWEFEMLPERLSHFLECNASRDVDETGSAIIVNTEMGLFR